MKYIRTKDGIYERDKVLCDEKFVYKYEVRPIWQINQESQEIVAQANTIEKLCDVFVCLGSAEYQKYVKHSLKEALQKKEWLKRIGYACNIYGAIWTDKGLIYVAKMNDEGELELL